MIPYPRLILSAIVARSRNRVIGRDGDLPWRLGSDLKHFKRITMGKPCLMGRKTWESLPFPLPGRPNLVLSRDRNYQADGAELFNDINVMIARGAELTGALGGDEVMIIGGAQLYKASLPHIQRIYETIVDVDISGDAVFPALDERDWTIRDARTHPAGPRDDHAFTTRVLDRRLAGRSS